MAKVDLEKTKNNIILFYKEGKLGEIINIVENELDENQIDALTNKIYVFSLIRLGRFREAEFIINELLDSYPEDYELLNALAYIELAKGNKTAGINLLLDAEYYAPEEVKQKIKSNLEEISKYKTLTPEIVIKQLKAKDFLVLNLPEVKGKSFSFSFASLSKVFKSAFGESASNVRNLLIVLGVVLAGFLVYFGLSYVLGVFSYSKQSKSVVSENIGKIEVESNAKLVEITPLLTNEIVLTDRQVSELFNELKLLLSKNRASNKARFIANYLLNSNASPSVKAKVEVLRTFMEEPTVLDWMPLYEEVNSKPNLYNGVFVIWKGRIVNVEKVGSSANFVFVVHGDTPSSIKGFMKAKMDNFLDGYVGEDIRVLGEIVADKDVYLKVRKVLE
jgi:tetratricopeptide (TPR) repeat protein